MTDGKMGNTVGDASKLDAHVIKANFLVHVNRVVKLQLFRSELKITFRGLQNLNCQTSKFWSNLIRAVSSRIYLLIFRWLIRAQHVRTVLILI